MGDFQPLARACEEHRVVTHDVPAARRMEPDLAGGALAGDTLPPMYRIGREIASERIGTMPPFSATRRMSVSLEPW